MTKASNFPISLEQAAYNEFAKEFQYGSKYLGMRFGQAFHTHFKLEKSTSQETRTQFRKLYELDGGKAKAAIRQLFSFN